MGGVTAGTLLLSFQENTEIGEKKIMKKRFSGFWLIMDKC